MTDKLKQAREIINDVDKQMAELFVKRMGAAKLVAEYKKEHGMPILDASREQQVIAKNSQYIEDDELRSFYVNFIQNTMDISKNYQRKNLEGMKIAYSGVEGAFAHFAAKKLFPDADLISHPNFISAYKSVVSGDCDSVVLPIENSSAGEVGQVTDLMFSGSLYINGVIDIGVTHNLITIPGAKLSEIKKVVSHPQALSQCKKYIKEHNLEEVPYENTALAAKYVSELNDPTVAAIASEESCILYGLEILSAGINEEAGNTTRFAVLSRSENKSIVQRHGVHSALMFTVKNEAGSLARALNIIGAHGFNMEAVRSRPMKELLWQYYFYVEIEGNIATNAGKDMLEALNMCCDQLKSLGSFVKY